MHQFLKFILGIKLYMFQTVLCSSSVLHCTHSNGICHTGLLTACEQDEDGTADGKRNCPKHVEFHPKNKFKKLVHLVGFIIRKMNNRRENFYTLRHDTGHK
jgi:hypothetical protein